MKTKSFSQKVYQVVSRIPKGKFLTYKKLAKLTGKDKAYRLIGHILSKNKNTKIPCHRVIRNNNLIGGYQGSYKNTWKKLGLLLKEGVIAVIPTDTIYGICGSALNKETVKKIYKIKKRNPKKPMIILISSLNDLNIFGVKISKKDKKILKKLWPAKISVILRYKSKKFDYLCNNKKLKTLAFRIPLSKFLIKVLKISGPLLAPSANLEGKEPAKTIREAKKYFGKEVIYYNYNIKKPSEKPSTLIKLENGAFEIIRKGQDLNKLKKLKYNEII